MAVSMVGPPKTDCPRVREKVIWESLYPILGSIRPHGLVAIALLSIRAAGSGAVHRTAQPLIYNYFAKPSSSRAMIGAGIARDKVLVLRRAQSCCLEEHQE